MSGLFGDLATKAFHSRYFAEVPINLVRRTFKAHELPASGPVPWLDRDDASEAIETKLARGEITSDEADVCRTWVSKGYVVLRDPLGQDFVDRTWSAYERAVEEGVVKLAPESAGEGDRWPGRFLDPHMRVPALHDALWHPTMLRWISLLLGRPALGFQTITSHKGSQQLEHSDSIHMTTYPLGYLAATWMAFEDIHPDSGPLVYYPGSHRLPYVFSHDVGITPREFRRSRYGAYNERYEPAIQRTIRERELRAETFLPKKGDILIWHANLIHGGSARKDLARSRKALVCHYFVEGAVCYHDLSGSLAMPSLREMWHRVSAR